MTATAPEQQQDATGRNAAIAALVTGYATQAGALRENLLLQVATLWKALGTYRTPQMSTFTNLFLPILTGAEQQMSALTAGYLAQHRALSLGTTVSPSPVRASEVTGPATRNGVAPLRVYERPFHQVWRDIGAGKNPTDAIDQGLTYAQNLASTDLQRTKQLTSQKVLKQVRGVIGYRRVLEGTYSCGLCIVASTQLYRKSQLLPIHPGCDCGVDPVYRDEGTPTYGVINMPLPQDVHAAIEEAFGASSPAAREIPGAILKGKPIEYRNVLVTHEHGELGPVIAVKGRHFIGPSDLS